MQTEGRDGEGTGEHRDNSINLIKCRKEWWARMRQRASREAQHSDLNTHPRTKEGVAGDDEGASIEVCIRCVQSGVPPRAWTWSCVKVISGSFEPIFRTSVRGESRVAIVVEWVAACGVPVRKWVVVPGEEPVRRRRCDIS
jgi:hypothetical protein